MQPAASAPPPIKKADAVERPQVFQHVGLLVNEPPGTGRFALYLVVQRIQTNGESAAASTADEPVAASTMHESFRIIGQSIRRKSLVLRVRETQHSHHRGSDWVAFLHAFHGQACCPTAHTGRSAFCPSLDDRTAS